MFATPSRTHVHAMTSFDELEIAFHQIPQREAAVLLLDAKLISMAFVANDCQITPQRLDKIKNLLRTIVQDQEHNPTTLRERIILDIIHALSFLATRTAITLHEHPDKLIKYLSSAYPQYKQYWHTLQLKEIDRIQRQLKITIEENRK